MNTEILYSHQLLMTAYSLSAILYTLRENKSEDAAFYKKATYEALTETLSDYMAEIGADEDVAIRELNILCKELDITDVNYIAWITEKWESAMSIFMEG